MPELKLNGKTYSGSTNYASAIKYVEDDGSKTTVQDKISEQSKNLEWKYLGATGTYDLTDYKEVKIGAQGASYMNATDAIISDLKKIGVNFLRTTVMQGNVTTQATLDMSVLSNSILEVLNGSAHVWVR